MKQVVVLLADWANGIFAVLLASWVTGVDVLWWHFLIGLLLSHVPDIDALPELLRRGRVAASAVHSADHRTFLHYPVFAVGLMALAVWFVGYWGWVLTFAVLLHLINDLYGTGWGLKVLWPLSNRNYKVLGRRVNRLKHILQVDGDWERLSVEERRLRPIISWSADELPQYITRWGVDDWVPYWYYNLNWVSGVEYILFGVACTAAIGTLIW